MGWGEPHVPKPQVATVAIAADDLDRFVGLTEAAARLDISPRTARRLAATRRLPVPVVVVAGKQVVSLRLLVEFINQGDRP